MNLEDISRKTELLRRKVKAIIFDRKNRRLSDKMYDELGNFLEQINKNGIYVSPEQFEKLDKRMDKLYELNTRRIEELNNDTNKDMDRMQQRLDKNIAKLEQLNDRTMEAMNRRTDNMLAAMGIDPDISIDEIEKEIRGK